MFKSIQIYHDCSDATDDIKHASTYLGNAAEWKMAYIVLTLITTLWCTILLLYRIINVAGSSHRARIRSYRGIIEALVESAALYSAILIIDIIFVAHNILSGGYIDIIGATLRVCLL